MPPMKGKQKQLLQQLGSVQAGPVTKDKAGNIVLQILAKPGAKANNIVSLDENCVNVQICARPVDGEANSELLKYISSLLGVKKNEISLDKGSKSRQKIIKITASDQTAESITEKLKSEIK